jgi:hypothetical protein
MKYLSKIILLTCAVAVPFAGCDTDTLHNYNINPQALTTVNMNFLFSAAQLGAASGGSEGDNRYIDWRTNIGYCGHWMQHISNLGTGGLGGADKYFENVEGDNAPWEFIYGGQLKNLQEVLKQTGPGGFEEGRRLNTKEAARILRAFLFMRLVDYYGNVPYTDALQGIEGIFTPPYNSGQEIYTSIIAELTAAGAAISAANPDDGFAASDMYFQGDITQWKKWANSLILRAAMRMSNKTDVSALVTQAVNGGVMTSNDDNVWVPMSETPSLWTNQNGISRAFVPGDGGQSRVMSKTLIDVLKGTDPNDVADDDPRLMIFTEGVNGDTDPLDQEGMPNGLDAGTLDAYTGMTSSQPALLFSVINLKLLDRNEPYLLMGYSEVELLLAEAKERGIGTVPGTAAEHYNAGVKAAMQMYTPYDATFAVSDADVNTYLATYPYATGAAGLEQIGTQMWLTKFLNWWDARADWRRTGYPALVEINYPGNITGGMFPTRLRYPSHEVATNATHIAVGGTSPDTHLGKAWWDD